jgi:hypothetical protein
MTSFTVILALLLLLLAEASAQTRQPMTISELVT